MRWDQDTSFLLFLLVCVLALPLTWMMSPPFRAETEPKVETEAAEAPCAAFVLAKGDTCTRDVAFVRESETSDRFVAICTCDKFWYIDNKRLTEAEFLAQTTKPDCTGRTVVIDGKTYVLTLKD